MASSSSKGTGGDMRSFAEKDAEAIDKFNRVMKESIDREARLLRHFEWRGNKLPPFSIEPQPHERQRLHGQWMTDEDRRLRRQWLKDQELAPNEPRLVPELYPKNPIRRMLAAPWDFTFRLLKPLVGEKTSVKGRFYVPKFFMTLAVFYAGYYHVKYNPNRWTDKHGLNIYSTKATLLSDGEEMPCKNHDDYYDRGFKDRKVLLGLGSSSSAQ